MLKFKYKLTLLISTIVLFLLFGASYMLRQQLETELTRDIKSKLEITDELIATLIEERRDRLRQIAESLRSHELIRTILTDRTLDRQTRDDITENEIAIYKGSAFEGIDWHEVRIRIWKITQQ